MSILHDVFAKVLRVPASSISDETSPETLRRWDSLRHLDVMTAIEDAFGAKFSTGEIMRATSVGQVRRLLHEKGIKVD